MNYLEILRQGSPLELAVILLLAVVSAVSWAIIEQKSAQLRRARSESARFLDTFWKATRLESLHDTARGMTGTPLAPVFCAGYEELTKLAERKDVGSERLDGLENVERALHRSSMAQIAHLESRIQFLATVGAAAPFVGLLGTVIGILNAFQEIGLKGNATLATVAVPVGNALFATAAGLFAAIPAVVAYNAFVSRLKTLDMQMAGFSADFLNIVRRHFFR